MKRIIINIYCGLTTVIVLVLLSKVVDYRNTLESQRKTTDSYRLHAIPLGHHYYGKWDNETPYCGKCGKIFEFHQMVSREFIVTNALPNGIEGMSLTNKWW